MGRARHIACIVAIVVGLAIVVAGCGRRGSPQAVDPDSTPQSGQTAETEQKKKKDKPFVLDFLL